MEAAWLAGCVFGRFAGFQAGWAFYIARLTAFSANAVLLVSAIGYAVLVCVALLTQVKPLDYLATALMLGVGSALYALARR